MRVAIVGAGAAGMMCAATILENNPETELFLLEKNDSLGKKVIISGGGRCNVTTGVEDIKIALSKYPRGKKFLISALHRFSPAAVRAWFEEHGIPLKCEKDLRVFPVSDDGKDIVNVFTKIFVHSGVQVLTKHNVKSITRQGKEFFVMCQNQPPLTVDRVVLALGGQAYRHTGSTGDGYTLAESLGHHITELAPSLHSFITKEKWPRALSGVSFIKANISADCPKPNTFTGAFLFTHTGISGPAVFALSSLTAFQNFGPAKPLAIFIDFVPEITMDRFIITLQQLLQANPKKSFKNILQHFVPLSLSEIICQEVGIPIEKKNAEITRQEVQKTGEWVKHLPLHAVARGAGDEFVTAGGVELSQVDPRTMESKLCPGLYLAGEILNVDGFTGGFNLQASWATGRVAGESIAQTRV